MPAFSHFFLNLLKAFSKGSPSLTIILTIKYSIVNTDSGVQLKDENGEDVNNIKSFRFTLGTFNEALELENDLGTIFSLTGMNVSTAQIAFEAFNPTEESIAEFNEFYFAGNEQRS